MAFACLVFGVGLFLPTHLAQAIGVPPVAMTGSAASIAGKTAVGLITNPIDTFVSVSNGIMLWVTELFLKITIFLLNFIIELASYHGYLDSPAVNIGWVLVRDLTNMGFVVILLVIAFGTILGLEQYEWKKLMVKFVLAAIFVNFSRVICGIIIDGAQVVMLTFVNGIAATAGGNLIQAFGMERMLSISPQATPGDLSSQGSFFIGLVVAITFSALLMAMMAVYMVILLARMITLWLLIVLSPLAFVLSVLPQTESMAKEWWKEFGNNVVSGPLAVFFIWLALVTVGAGDIHTKMAEQSTNRMDAVTTEAGAIGGANSAGIGDVMSWDKMANFFIGLGMLLLGAKKTQELGVYGASAMGGAMDFAKKVGMGAAGITSARFAYDNVAKPAAKWVGMNIPFVGGRSWQRRAEHIGEKGKRLWSNVNIARDKGAKDLELTNKERQAAIIERQVLEQRKKHNEISDKEYNKGIAENDKVMTRTGGIKGTAKRLGGSILSAVIESGGRKDKQLEDSKKSTEYQATLEEANWSTSSLSMGRLKQQLSGEADIAERMQKSKSEQKKAAAIARISNMDAGELALAQAEVDAGKKTLEEKEEILKKNPRDKAAQDAVASAKEDLAQAKEKVKEESKRQSVVTASAEHLAHVSGIEKEAAVKKVEGVFSTTGKGVHALEHANLAEQGKLAADEFVKGLKNKGLKDQFKEAAEAMNKILEDKTLTDQQKIQKMDKLADHDSFVRAMRGEKLNIKTGEELSFAKEQADNRAQGAFLDKRYVGSNAPSNALASAKKRAIDSYATLGPDALASAVADNLMLLAEANEIDPATGKPQKELSDYERMAAMGMMSKINDEGYLDNGIAELARRYSALEKLMAASTASVAAGGSALITAQQAAEHKRLKANFVDSGVVQKDVNGDWYGHNSSDPTDKVNTVAYLQAFATMGGDKKYIDQHRKIETTMDAEAATAAAAAAAAAANPANTALKTAAAAAAAAVRSYDEVAEKELGTAYAQFAEISRANETYLKDAADSFTKAGLANGHQQLIGQFKFDTVSGRHRLATTAEAKDRQVSERIKATTPAHGAIQFQTLGAVNANTGDLLSIERETFATVFSQVISYLEAARVKPRTVSEVLGVRPGEEIEKVNNLGNIGNGKAGITRSFATVADFFQKKLLNELVANPRAFGLIANQGFKNANKIEGENGIVRARLELDSGPAVEGEKMSEFLGAIIKAIEDPPGSRLGVVDPADVAALKAHVVTFKKLESKITP
ncbi:MAG: hypothetical protein Q7S66_01130 [bacterium]|nr:hypothetical protein [bacterium]